MRTLKASVYDLNGNLLLTHYWPCANNRLSSRERTTKGEPMSKSEETKVCAVCKTEKPLSMFPKWRTKCRACRSVENSARLKERYANDPKFAAAVQKRAADWQRVNAEKSNEYHRRRHAKKIAAGDEAYISKMTASQRKYRNSKKGRSATAARMQHYEESGRAKAWRAARRAKPESRASQMVAGARNRAVKMNVPCDVVFDDVYAPVVAGKCQKTGIAFDLEPHPDHRVHPWAPSIDRIDGRKGYTKKNIQVVCWAYNSARNQWGDDVLLRLAHAIVDANRKTGV